MKVTAFLFFIMVILSSCSNKGWLSPNTSSDDNTDQQLQEIYAETAYVQILVKTTPKCEWEEPLPQENIESYIELKKFYYSMEYPVYKEKLGSIMEDKIFYDSDDNIWYEKKLSNWEVITCRDLTRVQNNVKEDMEQFFLNRKINTIIEAQ